METTDATGFINTVGVAIWKTTRSIYRRSIKTGLNIIKHTADGLWEHLFTIVMVAIFTLLAIALVIVSALAVTVKCAALALTTLVVVRLGVILTSVSSIEGSGVEHIGVNTVSSR